MSIKSRNIFVDVLIAVAIAAFCIVGYSVFKGDVQLLTGDEDINELHDYVPAKQYKFGFSADEHHFETGRLQENEFLGDILNANGISFSEIFELEKKAKAIYDVRQIKAGKKYHIVREDICSDKCLAFIYEPDPLNYVVYDFQDSITVDKVEKEFDIVLESASGEITSSLWQSMQDQNINPGLIDLMEDALASSVSFFHTKKGDKFKLVYERKYIDGEPIALGRLVGAYYENAYGQYYSVFYGNDRYEGYYDELGRPTKRAFLKSPIKGSARISSRYNLRRLHPIKKRRIPHYGTDYAAPYGTPITSVANGVITHASYTRNNGRYVKITHDKTYKTQYLHMQKFAAGIRPGVQVKQGQVIGYVGSTGLATGPHVCFRFWKNGRQIDHLRENFPPAKPLPEEELNQFYSVRDSVKFMLDQIPFASESTYAENRPL